MTYEEYKILSEKLNEIIFKFVNYKSDLEKEIIEFKLKLDAEANFAVKSSEATEEEINESGRLVDNDRADE